MRWRKRQALKMNETTTTKASTAMATRNITEPQDLEEEASFSRFNADMRRIAAEKAGDGDDDDNEGDESESDEELEEGEADESSEGSEDDEDDEEEAQATTAPPVVVRRRGRPVGSKNRPKEPKEEKEDMARPITVKGKPLLIDVPIEELTEKLAEVGPTTLFWARISRRNDRGQLQTFPRLDLTIPEIINIETRLAELAGGGDYEVEVRHSEDPRIFLVPKFKAYVPGLPSAPRIHGSTYDQNVHNSALQRGNGIPPGFTPNWVHGLPPSAQQHYMQTPVSPAGASPPVYGPGATVPSDRLAMHQGEMLNAQVAELRTELRTSRERYEDKIAQLEKEARLADEKATQAAHRAELSALSAKLEALTQARNEPKTSGFAESAAAFAPFVPALVAFISARENGVTKSAEMASQNLHALMQATLSQANKPDAFERLLPTLLPLLKEMMTNRKGTLKEDMAVIQMMMEGSMNQAGMITQLVESLAGGENDKPWWMDILRETLDGSKNMMAAYLENMVQQNNAPQLPPGRAPQLRATPTNGEIPFNYTTAQPQQQPQQQSQPQHQQAPIDTTMEPVVVASQNPGPLQSPPLTAFDKILISRLPPDFQTKPWQLIVRKLHHETDVEALAGIIVSHIEHCIEFEELPNVLADVTTDPASALSRVLAPLPIAAQKPEMMRSLVELCIAGLEQDGFLVEAAPMAQPLTDEEAAEEARRADAAGEAGFNDIDPIERDDSAA